MRFWESPDYIVLGQGAIREKRQYVQSHVVATLRWMLMPGMVLHLAPGLPTELRDQYDFADAK